MEDKDKEAPEKVSVDTTKPASEPQKIDVTDQPTSIDRFNHGSNILARALSLSKNNQFKSVALSYTDLEFLQHVVNAGISAAVQYSNLTGSLLRRDPILRENLENLHKTSDHLLEQLNLMRVGLTNSIELSMSIVKPRPLPTEEVIEKKEDLAVEPSEEPQTSNLEVDDEKN